MDKIAVLIPCYNEAQTIGKVVRDFKAVLPDAVAFGMSISRGKATWFAVCFVRLMRSVIL